MPQPLAKRPNAAARRRHEAWLIELTSLPTAAFHEHAVLAWLAQWLKARPHLAVKTDRFGNLLISRTEVESTPSPLIFTAHLDHPAFVIRDIDGPLIRADFLGGVRNAYFVGARVRAWPEASAGSRRKANGSPAAMGRIEALMPPVAGTDDKRIIARFPLAHARTLQAGNVMTWQFTGRSKDITHGSVVEDGRLRAPACDDLAAVAATVSVLDQLKGGAAAGGDAVPDVRVLLTRAEEVGFVGALASIKSGLVPRKARLICLENSKSFAESPIGGGPIIRVGDRISTFHPVLTRRLADIAESLVETQPGFAFQRRLMPGGACEASAFQAAGYTATCICLPLGGYHNMGPLIRGRGRVVPEEIAVDDYHRLVHLLLAIAAADPLSDKDQQNDRFAQRLAALLDHREAELLTSPSRLDS